MRLQNRWRRNTIVLVPTHNNLSLISNKDNDRWWAATVEWDASILFPTPSGGEVLGFGTEAKTSWNFTFSLNTKGGWTTPSLHYITAEGEEQLVQMDNKEISMLETYLGRCAEHGCSCPLFFWQGLGVFEGAKEGQCWKFDGDCDSKW